MYMTGNLYVWKDLIGLTVVLEVLDVHIRTFLQGTHFSEKNIHLVKKSPALNKSKYFNGTIFPMILEHLLYREK